MAADPEGVTIGELSRRQDTAQQELRDLRRDSIGRNEYEADQEGHAAVHADLRAALTEQKTDNATALSTARAELSNQIAEETTARSLEVAAVNARLDKTGNNLRWVAASILLPIAVFVAGILLNRGR